MQLLGRSFGQYRYGGFDFRRNSAPNFKKLERRIGDRQLLESEIAVWEQQRNRERASVNWRFKTTDARRKMGRLYPPVSPCKVDLPDYQSSYTCCFFWNWVNFLKLNHLIPPHYGIRNYMQRQKSLHRPTETCYLLETTFTARVQPTKYWTSESF